MMKAVCIFFNDTAATEIYTYCHTLSLHDALPIWHWAATDWFALSEVVGQKNVRLYPASLAEWSQNAKLPMENVPGRGSRSEEHTSELQSLMRISYAVFCLKKTISILRITSTSFFHKFQLSPECDTTYYNSH